MQVFLCHFGSNWLFKCSLFLEILLPHFQSSYYLTKRQVRPLTRRSQTHCPSFTSVKTVTSFSYHISIILFMYLFNILFILLFKYLFIYFLFYWCYLFNLFICVFGILNTAIDLVRCCSWKKNVYMHDETVGKNKSMRLLAFFFVFIYLFINLLTYF